MSMFQIDRRFFESPHPAVYVLMAINIVVFAICLSQSDRPEIPSALLFRNGAMHWRALEREEYWRFITAGFLHAGFLHVATNMFCLALWGGHLERRIGSTYFLVIYLGALIAGSITGLFTHTGPYLSVGASGAISGILGALLCLRLLGKLDLSFQFFAVNIGLNIVVGFTARNIDWGAHLGGFVAGIAICALLELVERANGTLLRCRFPEFVKLNAFLLTCGCLTAAWFWRIDLVLGVPVWLMSAGCIVLGLGAVKLLDLALSRRHGLAAAVVALSVADAVLAAAAVAALAPAVCRVGYAPAIVQMRNLTTAACASPLLTLLLAAALAGVLVFLLLSQEFNRGMRDIGFIGASFTGERQRRRGL
jgi:rhomboid protease GluP